MTLPEGTSVSAILPMKDPHGVRTKARVHLTCYVLRFISFRLMPCPGDEFHPPCSVIHGMRIDMPAVDGMADMTLRSSGDIFVRAANETLATQ